MTPDPMNPLVEAIAQRVVALLAAQPKQPLAPRLLTVDQAATYLGRTDKSVRHLASTGAFPSVRADGRVMFDVKDLDSWIDCNKQ